MGTDLARPMSDNDAAARQRIDWVDYAKGFCIIFVVMMHSTLGVGQAAGSEGWLHYVVAFAQPFRMPDFFLISGLFLAQVINRDWRTYLDRKVVHFVYFYLLWTAIQFALKAPGLVQGHGVAGVAWLYLETFWEPFGTLWFIYLLPIFFVVTKLAHGWRIPVLAIWLVAAALEIAPIHTGWTIVDEFAGRFVYFYTGYILAPRIFDLAARCQAQPETALAGLTIWGLANGILVFNGVAGLPFVSLALGLAGAAAVVAVSALLAQIRLFEPLRYCGEHSIVIYLAFFLGMAASRSVLLKYGWISDIGTISAIVTLSGTVRRADPVLGGAPHAAAVPVRAAGTVLDRAARSRRSCDSCSPRTSDIRCVTAAREDVAIAAADSPHSGHGQSPASTSPASPRRATTSFWSTVPATFSAPITRCRRSTASRTGCRSTPCSASATCCGSSCAT